jgi:DNA polymerase-1
VVDVLALMGDSVDNVPGVPGIGEKGAKNLIREYGSLDSLLEHASEVKRKSYREGLEQHADDAHMSRELVTIETELPVPLDLDALTYEPPDPTALAELYRELEFFNLLKELEAEGGLDSGPELAPAIEARDAGHLGELLSDAGPSVSAAVVGTPPLGLAIELARGEVLFADFRTEGVREVALGAVRSWLADPERVLVGHDLKELLRVVGWSGAVPARLCDTMLLAYLLRSSIRDFSFEEVCLERLHFQPIKLKDAGFAKGAEPLPGDVALLEVAAQRAALPSLLLERMEGELNEEEGPGAAARRLFEQIGEPLIPVLLGMERSGVLLDVPFLEQMSRDLGEQIVGLEDEIYELAGERFNINSPRQLGVILFEKLDYPVLRRTRKTKSYSTGADTLEELAAHGFDLPERILRFREWSKLKSTYVDALPALVADDGRVHTHYQQAVAATGRLSSVNPNLQNIPVRTDAGRNIRKAFCAPEGRLLFVADYSQIELRVLAHIADEPALIEAFRNEEDIHSSTAALVFGGSPALVSPDQRRAAKVINFGIIYGMSAFGLANNLGIEQKEAKQFIEAYFDRFPAVKRYTDETIEWAGEHGRVETLYGRARWLADLHSKNWNLRENAKRMAINARIQGTAADLLKKAMIAVDARLRAEQAESALLLTVHDELVLEVPADRVDEVRTLVVEEMEGVETLAVPLRVDSGAGVARRWRASCAPAW